MAKAKRQKITPELIELIRREALKMTGEDCLEAQVLLSSIVVGPNVKRIASFLSVPRDDVSYLSVILRRNGIWRGGKVAASEWFGKDGGIAFICDVAVAKQQLKKTWAEA